MFWCGFPAACQVKTGQHHDGGNTSSNCRFRKGNIYSIEIHEQGCSEQTVNSKQDNNSKKITQPNDRYGNQDQEAQKDDVNQDFDDFSPVSLL